MKSGHNYSNLIQSQTAFYKHEQLMIPDNCTKYENQHILWDITTNTPDGLTDWNHSYIPQFHLGGGGNHTCAHLGASLQHAPCIIWFHPLCSRRPDRQLLLIFLQIWMSHPCYIPRAAYISVSPFVRMANLLFSCSDSFEWPVPTWLISHGFTHLHMSLP